MANERDRGSWVGNEADILPTLREFHHEDLAHPGECYTCGRTEPWPCLGATAADLLEALQDEVRTLKQSIPLFCSHAAVRALVDGLLAGREQIRLRFEEEWGHLLEQRRRALRHIREVGEACAHQALSVEYYVELHELAIVLELLGDTSRPWGRLVPRYGDRIDAMMNTLGDAVCGH